MNLDNYIYVDIFDIPDVMKVRTQYKVASDALYSSPRIAYDGIVKLAEEIQPFVRHMKQRDFGTDEYIITDTLFVIPPDCKRLAIPKPEPKKKNEWIPVTERLPEEDGLYLISHQNGKVFLDKWLGYDGWENFISVKAWMPLPKPYKGGDA